MANEPQTAVTFGDGWELRLSDLRNALSRHYDHQKMMVSRGSLRQPDANSDLVTVTVRKDGKVVAGWRVEEVGTNLHGRVGVTTVTLYLPDVARVEFIYVPHEQTLLYQQPVSRQPS